MISPDSRSFNAKGTAPRVLSYIIVVLGFIPVIGLPFAISSFVIGCLKRRDGGLPLIILGLLPIIISINILFHVIYPVFHSAERDAFIKGNNAIAGMYLDKLVPVIEDYKRQKGVYPQSLDEVKALNPSIGVLDSTHKNDEFYYRLAPDGAHYYLRSSGLDGIPFTADDVVPQMPEVDRVKTGLLIAPPSSASSGQ